MGFCNGLSSLTKVARLIRTNVKLFEMTIWAELRPELGDVSLSSLLGFIARVQHRLNALQLVIIEVESKSVSTPTTVLELLLL